MIEKKADIRSYFFLLSTTLRQHYTLFMPCFAVLLFAFIGYAKAGNSTSNVEPVQACLLHHPKTASLADRLSYAQCLEWQEDASNPLCGGYYSPITLSSLPEGQVRIQADEASLYAEGRSKLRGHVKVQENQRMVEADTAYIHRDPKSNEVTQIELFGNVRYVEPGRLLLASKAIMNPQNKSGRVDNVLYRLSVDRAHASLPAWGTARFVERYANQDYLLNQATYSTCPPKDRAWQLSAESIKLDYSESKGIARNATLRLYDIPVLYTPYFSFATEKKRKSGFLMPVGGYSNVGGFDLGVPYYWNIAPNYDATITPHVYSRRGVMLGGEFRYLTPYSFSVLGGQFLPDDKAFQQFINENQAQYPVLRGQSNNRWYASIFNQTKLNNHLSFGVNYQEVSDDYYLQDFSSNLALTTQSQILQQANLNFDSEHWVLDGLVQSYQTLHPINQSTVSDIYQRLPYISAQGYYGDLPWDGQFNLYAQIDNYRWPANYSYQPQGPRMVLIPAVDFSINKPWGYITPAAQLVESNYRVKLSQPGAERSFNQLIPRTSVDSGLFFDRAISIMNESYTQTLEPRLFYLYVPFHNQTAVPVYDSAYMIFSYDQLFRSNRFSGFDRIGDANQLAYAFTTRFLSDASGQEKASLSIGQMRYFSNRRVELCYDEEGFCIENPLTLGYLSPVAKSSPVAVRGRYKVNPYWQLLADYAWDPYTRATNNGYLNLHYQPDFNKIVSVGYSYLVNGDITRIANTQIVDNVLSQATLAYSFPLTDRWSTLGVYSHNISKHYGMMSFLGLQYENCCWAIRFMGGRTFKNISTTTLKPVYNSNVYAQILLKGLGSASSSDPSQIISTYLPGYQDIFRK